MSASRRAIELDGGDCCPQCGDPFESASCSNMASRKPDNEIKVWYHHEDGPCCRLNLAVLMHLAYEGRETISVPVDRSQLTVDEEGLRADGGKSLSGSERHCVLCGEELTNDLDIDTGVCGDCAEDTDPDSKTWLVSYEWMDGDCEWCRTDYPVVASNEREARRKAGMSSRTPDSYSDVSVRELSTEDQEDLQ